jgi:arginine decarboxylase
MGQINLRQRATADIIFWNIIQQIAINTRKLKRLPQELVNIESAIADIYYGNFSLFQSLPDSWAIEHLFPIMPIHRLEKPPTRNAVFGDITCDSDGKIERFIDQHDVCHSLPVHEINNNDEYYIGAFLVGAYQETLGDLHNLLGDTNIVNIRINSDSSFDFVKELEGDTISEVLSYVEYNIRALRDQFRAKAEKAVKEGKISVKERREILAAYENGLRGYTYFER